MRGTIVLVPFPFTDLSDAKIRPALVVSRSERADNDVVLAFIGTYRGQTIGADHLLVEDSHPDFGRTGLKVSSIILLDRLMTLSGGDLIGKLGSLSADLIASADHKLRASLEL